MMGTSGLCARHEESPVSDVHTIIVCSWQDCLFVADAPLRFAEAYDLSPRECEVLHQVIDGLDIAAISGQ